MDDAEASFKKHFRTKIIWIFERLICNANVQNTVKSIDANLVFIYAIAYQIPTLTEKLDAIRSDGESVLASTPIAFVSPFRVILLAL